MKKLLLVVLALLVFSSIAMSQSFVAKQYGAGTTGGIPFNIDKLGAHQNGGRGCVGCHAPHSGARGNGGSMVWDSVNKKFVQGKTVSGDVGDEVLWGQDLGPIYGTALNFPKNGDSGASGTLTITSASPERMITGVAMCLSCHDGKVAAGAMMTNQSFEQVGNMLPAGYGTQPIPTLLGVDGGTMGNYQNDHPVGPAATLGSVGHGAIGNCATVVYAPTGCKAKNYFAIGTDSSGKKVLVAGTGFANSAMAEFAKNYGLPTSIQARAGAGWAINDDAVFADEAYVVCTTCHTPHSMYTASVDNKTNYGGSENGTYPSYFFIAAAYNPGANTVFGTKASSATQFCRQCHFSGPGGSNEASGISIKTAW